MKIFENSPAAGALSPWTPYHTDPQKCSARTEILAAPLASLYLHRSVIEKELSHQSEASPDPFRISKLLLLWWANGEALEICWNVVLKEVLEMCNGELNSLSESQILKVGAAVQILQACDPTGRAGHLPLASLDRNLHFLVSSDSRATISVPRSASIKGPLRQLNKMINNLQVNRVPTLAQVSVHAIRNALFSPIRTTVDVLLNDLPPPQQSNLRPQILLSHALVANALQGIDEAFASVETLKSTLNMPFRNQC